MTTEAADDRSFVWNGCYTGGVNKKSNGIGTFSVYTQQGGLDGFYVNGKPLPERISEATESKFLNLAGKDSQTVVGDITLSGKTAVGINGNEAIAPGSFCAGDGGNHAGFKAFKVAAVHEATTAVDSDPLAAKWWVQIEASDAEIEAIDSKIVSSIATYGGKIQCVLHASGVGEVETEWPSTYGVNVLGWADKASKKLEVDSLFYGVFDNGEGGATCSGNYYTWSSNGTTKPMSKLHLYFPIFPTIGGEKVYGDGATCLGYCCLANDDAVAAGCYSYALGRFSLAVGINNEASYSAVALGSGNVAAGCGSIALGGAYNAAKHWLRRGSNCVVLANRAFGWNGTYRSITNNTSEIAERGPDYVVPREREGSFNVNPFGGINGFYIGDSDFVECVVQAVEKMTDAQKARLKSALGLS